MVTPVTSSLTFLDTFMKEEVVIAMTSFPSHLCR